MKRKPKKEKKPKNPPPVGVMSPQQYRDFLKGRYMPPEWE